MCVGERSCMHGVMKRGGGADKENDCKTASLEA